MVNVSIIRHLLCDKDSLTDYVQRRDVALSDVRRRLMLIERLENRSNADHYYRLNEEQSFKNVESLRDIFTYTLPKFSDKYLELRENKIYVQQSMQNQWQELITYIPPMTTQVAFLFEKTPLTDTTLGGIKNYCEKYLTPNFKYTALPHPYIPQLESYIEHHNGLHDLHMHLNGSTESDIIWQDLLYNPDISHSNLASKLSTAKVREQLEQEGYVSDDISFRSALLLARRIRLAICNYIFCKISDYSPLCSSGKCSKRPNCLFSKAVCNNGGPAAKNEVMNNIFDLEQANSIYHPMLMLFKGYSKNSAAWLPMEALFYALTLRMLDKYNNEFVASLFHFYLLLQGLANRLMVQQTQQYGFEQFQKITLNDLRVSSESKYLTRFLQLHGNECRNIKFMEGRFSPKKTESENESLIQTIQLGWKMLISKLSISDTSDKPQLKLIAHFIKQQDKSKRGTIRHKGLRKDIRQKADVLGIMISNCNPSMENVVGIDAAASEFDTPPEVFAPIYRQLRRQGVKHFTYHAGEDFFHIISGLRAIYEAVEFCDLKTGDRIGHGTAMGVLPHIWHRNIGDCMLIRQGEWLDDLVFAYHLIATKKSTLTSVLYMLESEIYKLHYQIYGIASPINSIINAWLNRYICPIHLLPNTKTGVFPSLNYELEEIERIYPRASRGDNVEFKLIEMYHHYKYVNKYNEIIEIDPFKLFNEQETETLQLLVLEHLHSKEIVIETLPTSNVRIGVHSNFDTYHLWRWLELQKQGHPIPPIIVGTDDAGIFATNIYNEYVNIYCHLTSKCKAGHIEAMSIIKQLENNGLVYRFQ